MTGLRIFFKLIIVKWRYVWIELECGTGCAMGDLSEKFPVTHEENSATSMSTWAPPPAAELRDSQRDVCASTAPQPVVGHILDDRRFGDLVLLPGKGTGLRQSPHGTGTNGGRYLNLKALGKVASSLSTICLQNLRLQKKNVPSMSLKLCQWVH